MNESVTVGLICVVVVVIALILTLLTPWYCALDSESYGIYERIDGECKPPGLRTVEYVCHPHPINNRGCDLSTIPSDQKGISYATIRLEHQPCSINRVASEWSEPVFGECVESNQQVTRTCLLVNSSGVNNCFVPTGNNGVLYYSPGDKHTVTQPCISSKPIHGEWILLDPVQAEHLPRNTNIPVTIPFETLDTPPSTLFAVSSQCLSDGVLEEGVLMRTIACKLGEEMVIPTSSTETACIGVVPDNLRMTACLYLPRNYVYYHLSLPDGRVIQEIPLNGTQHRTIGYSVERADVGLIVGTGIPVPFLFLHEEEGMTRIAVIMSNGLFGFLGVNADRHLVWQQGKIGPNSPGISLSDARVFSIDMIPSLNGVRVRLSGRFYVNSMEGAPIRVRDFIGTPIEV